jgi:hypothetical protein
VTGANTTRLVLTSNVSEYDDDDQMNQNEGDNLKDLHPARDARPMIEPHVSLRHWLFLLIEFETFHAQTTVSRMTVNNQNAGFVRL